MRLGELGAALGAELVGSPAHVVHRCARLAEAGPDALAAWFPGTPAVSTQAGAVIAQRPSAELGVGNWLICSDPRRALRRALALLHPPPRRSGRHPRAWVDESAQIPPSCWLDAFCVVQEGVRLGPGCQLGPHSCVMRGATLGARVRLGAGVVIRPGTVLDDDVEVQDGSVIGSDGFAVEPTPEGPARVPHAGWTHLEAGVQVGALSAVDRGLVGPTRIGGRSQLDNLVQVGHGARLGRGVVLAAQTGVAGSVELGDGVAAGGQVGIIDHRRVVAGVRLAARAGVTRDIQRAGDYGGFPARPIARWRRAVVGLRRLEHLERRIRRLEARLRAQEDADE